MRTADGKFAIGSTIKRRHGLCQTKEYVAWCGMKSRCNNENFKFFKNYGGRGIKVCDRWKDFYTFFEDMGPVPDGKSLDRIDNEKGYSPENCRWATRTEQARNKRNLVFITANGETKCLGEWSEQTGIKVSTLSARLKLGWADDKVVNTPIQENSRWHRDAYGAENGVVFNSPKEQAA
jgi:hypothetical protein